MKRFHFPLDRVRRYRQLLVEAEEVRLEGLLAQVRQIDERLAVLEREGRSTAAQVRQSLAATCEVRPREMAAYPVYRSLLARNRQGLEQERRHAVEAVDRQRAAVIEVRRAREILERARLLAQEHWQAEYLKEQESTAGELYLSKWKRRVRR